MAGWGYALAGLAQGLGAGLVKQAELSAIERRERALANERAKHESYTLGPGDVRYNSEGVEIARGPERGAELTGKGRELIEAGYMPGTKAYKDAMAAIINGSYGSDYVDEQGNVRRRSPLNLSPGQSGDAQPTAPTATAPNQSAPVRVKSIEEARQLPPGTRFTDPSGRTWTVPGGGGSNATGGFL